MGTGAYIFLRAKEASKLITYCKLYVHFDGYIDALGIDLIKFLAPKLLVNGLGTVKGDIANGPECLFAQTVAHLKMKPYCEGLKHTPFYSEIKELYKNGAGLVYLHNPNCDEEAEWNYYVDCDDTKPIQLTIKSGERFHFSGTVGEAFHRFVVNREHEKKLEEDDSEH